MAAPTKPLPLNEFLDSLISESRSATSDIKREWDTNLDNYRGDAQWPSKRPKHRVPFTYNKSGLAVKRITAMMTDTMPSIDVKPRASGLTEVAEIITSTIRAIWEEQQFDQKFANRLIPMSMVFGACPVHLFYDPTADNGRGDVSLEPIDPRSFFIDPAVTAAEDLSKAEYVGFQSVMSLNRIRQMWPKRGADVEADPAVSQFVDPIGRGGGISVQSPTREPIFRGKSIKSSAIDRANVQYFWIRDLRTVGELPEEIQEEAFAKGLTKDDLAWPNGRGIFRAGPNKKILEDGNSIYMDSEPPFEMFSWDIEFEHPWGMSLIKTLKVIQDILNKLGSAVTENAVKMNNAIWIGDKHALSPSGWNELSDAPGLLVQLNPGTKLERQSPPALPGSVFQMIQFLSLAIDDISGLLDVSQGRRPVGIVSASALEALQLAAQTLVRLQSRAYEAFLQRLGQKLVSRIFQFYTQDRMFYLHGPNDQVIPFEYERQKIRDAQIGGQDGPRPFDPFKDFRDLRLQVSRASSLAATRMQKGVVALALADRGLVPGEDVLKVLEWPNPKETFKQAQQEMAEKAFLGLVTKGSRGGGGSTRLRIPRNIPQGGGDVT